LGTLIRHAHQGGGPAFAVLALAVAMIQPAFGTALMTLIRGAVLKDSRLATASCAAITLAAIAMRADEEQRRAVATQTKPRAENRFAMSRHVVPPAALTTANRSWEGRN
jgi:hypothetical protein